MRRRGSHETIPAWEEGASAVATFPPLQANTSADVAIVGAGIAGLTTGYLLAKQGKSVVICDSWGLAAGETGRTTAHLTAVLDDRFFDLESTFGAAGARHAAESHMSAIHRIEAIVHAEQIACDFERVDGFLVALSDKEREEFEKEHPALRRAGFADLEVHRHLPLKGMSLAVPTIRFPRQACFHILKYMNGLAAAFQKLGGRIHGGTRIVEVRGGRDSCLKSEAGHTIGARAVVVATNSPMNERVTMHAKQAAYRTYVIAYRVAKDSLAGFLLWDMAHPYHYVRVVRGDTHDLLLVGGEDHKTGQAQDMSERYERLDAWTKSRFPAAGSIAYRWSGQILEPANSLAFIGRNPGDADNVYIATGDSGNGMTHGTIAGMLITDLVTGRSNDWAELYDPARKPTRSLGEFVSENLNAVGHLVTDWLKYKPVGEVDALANEEGDVFASGTDKIAAYRDGSGKVHRLSAVCTHLGCVPQWNPGEKTWDCPCHGSRFDIDGRVLNAPAVKALPLKAAPA